MLRNKIVKRCIGADVGIGPYAGSGRVDEKQASSLVLPADLLLHRAEHVKNWLPLPCSVPSQTAGRLFLYSVGLFFKSVLCVQTWINGDFSSNQISVVLSCYVSPVYTETPFLLYIANGSIFMLFCLTDCA